nr:BMA-TSP-17, isoform b [Brugia malayi]
MSENTNGQCAQICLLFYTVFFWLTGLALIFLSLWTLLDPRRNYLLDLVDFSEDDPLLRGACHLALITGSVVMIVGFIGCCGTIKKSLCLLITFVICLLILFFADITIACLALFYRNKFVGNRLSVYLTNLTHDRYYRLYWVTPLIDIIQYYQQCCGATGPHNYYDSFWYKTNTERGTISFVPQSCCKQMREARTWFIKPVDPMCTSYNYYTSAFNSSVNAQGCHEKLLDWLTAQTIIFVLVGLSFAIFKLIGVCIALSLLQRAHNLNYYNTV